MATDDIKKAGVVGWPVSHSLSPRLHNYWLQKYNIAGEYKAYPVEPEKLPEFIENIRNDKNFRGVNLTIPHKEAALKLLDGSDPSALFINAVNTIVIEDGKLYGKNTDAYGFAENIRQSIINKNRAVVLGAGGAAKGVIFALKQLGFAEIIVTNRTLERAEILVSGLPKLFIGGQMLPDETVKIAPWEKRDEILKNTDLLVNATSLGLKDNSPLEINLSELSKAALVTDIVYSPLITPLLEQAKTRGNPTIDGLGMLLHQAVPAFEAWFGVKPEVTEELRQYVLSGK